MTEILKSQTIRIQMLITCNMKLDLIFQARTYNSALIQGVGVSKRTVGFLNVVWQSLQAGQDNDNLLRML